MIKRIAAEVATEVAEECIKTLIPRLVEQNKIKLIIPKEEDSDDYYDKRGLAGNSQDANQY